LRNQQEGKMVSLSSRLRTWNIVTVIAFGLYSTLFSIDNYVGIERKQEQQQQRIVSTTTQLQHLQQSNSILPVSQLVYSNTTPGTESNQNLRINNNQTGTVSFPRWSGSIGVDPLMDAIRIALSGRLRLDRAHRVYIVNERGEMYRANVPRPYTADQAPYRRAKTMETLAIQVINYIQNTRNDTIKYPYMKAILRHGGFAYIANYADSKFCAERPPFVDVNWKVLLNDTSVPIFSLAAPVNCQRAFPTPTYETIEQSDLDWVQLIPYYRSEFPRSQQHRQAIWRGGPTGHNVPMRNTRIQLCLHAIARPDLLDIKIVKHRQQWDLSKVGNTSDFHEDELIGEKIPMVDFQKYRAIIDVDGHSWSSRFGKLLCYNSVVLKVQPKDVDYFHPQLQPWVHYIPIQSNLSNLYDMVSYAISDDPSAIQIIRNANQWCLEHLNRPRLIHDMAHIWDRYAYHLLLDRDVAAEESMHAPFSQQHLSAASSSYSAAWLPNQLSLLREYNFNLVSE
jgi:Glycosyl transferase family 90